jgi:hypothetical protein
MCTTRKAISSREERVIVTTAVEPTTPLARPPRTPLNSSRIIGPESISAAAALALGFLAGLAGIVLTSISPLRAWAYSSADSVSAMMPA